jgi:hypothetical protein
VTTPEKFEKVRFYGEHSITEWRVLAANSREKF